LLTLLEYLSSIMVFSGVCVAQSLVLCVVFCLSLFVFSVLCVVFCLSLFVFSEVYVAQSLVLCVVFCLSLFVFSEVCVAQSLVLCVVFCQLLFVFFPLAIVLSVLPFMASNYPFGIFKLFLQNQIVHDIIAKSAIKQTFNRFACQLH